MFNDISVTQNSNVSIIGRFVNATGIRGESQDTVNIAINQQNERFDVLIPANRI